MVDTTTFSIARFDSATATILRDALTLASDVDPVTHPHDLVGALIQIGDGSTDPMVIVGIAVSEGVSGFGRDASQPYDLVLLSPSNEMILWKASRQTFDFSEISDGMTGQLTNPTYAIQSGYLSIATGLITNMVPPALSVNRAAIVAATAGITCRYPIIIYTIPVPFGPLHKIGCKNTSVCQNLGKSCKLSFDIEIEQTYCKCRTV